MSLSSGKRYTWDYRLVNYFILITGVWERVCEKEPSEKSEIIWNVWKYVFSNELKVWKFEFCEEQKVWNQIKIWTLTSLLLHVQWTKIISL